MKRLVTLFLALVLVFNMTACGFQDAVGKTKGAAQKATETVKETAKSATESAKETAGNAAETVKDAAETVKNDAVELIGKIDLSFFERGWKSATDLAGSIYAAPIGSQYIKDVAEQIDVFRADINASVGSARGVAQEAGYVAEKWAADTFNINAAVKGSEERAWAVGSNKLGSVDVDTSWGEQYSLKYYKDAEGSAQAQAKATIKAYSESNSDLSLREYMDQSGFSPEIRGSLEALYEGQTRLIPPEQVPEAV